MKVNKVQKAFDKASTILNQLDSRLWYTPNNVQDDSAKNQKKLNKHFRHIQKQAQKLVDALAPAIQETDPVTDEN